jgi:hypothetical protein
MGGDLQRATGPFAEAVQRVDHRRRVLGVEADIDLVQHDKYLWQRVSPTRV